MKKVLGIKIDDISLNEAKEVIFAWLKKGDKHQVVTANPEIVLKASEDKELKDIINRADLVLPDGAGLRIGTDIVCYSPGVDLMELIIKDSIDYGFTIGLLGGAKGVAEKCADCLRKKYPKIRIVYIDSGGVIDEAGEWIEGNRKAFTKTDLLFVAFGPPKQEKWIYKNLKNIPVKVAIGVGGAFDYLSGEVPRAPKILRSIGLEWFFRLIVQPWRLKRQLKLFKYLWLLANNN